LTIIVSLNKVYCAEEITKWNLKALIEEIVFTVLPSIKTDLGQY